MADATDLETGTPVGVIDPNTGSGFMEAIAKSLGKEVPEGGFESAPSTSVAAGLTFGEETPQEPAPAVAAQVEPVVAPAAAGDEADPDVAAYLERYQGDSDKALKAAVEAQKLIGRQGNELGKAREEAAFLRGKLEAQQAAAAAQPAAQAQLITPEVIESVETAVAEQGGQQIAMWTLQNRPDLYDYALSAWEDIDRNAARAFNRRYEVELAKAEAAKVTPASADNDDEFVASLKEAATMESALGTVAEATPDWKEIAPYMTPALEKAPVWVNKAVIGQSAEISQEEAIGMVAAIARNLHTEALKTQGNTAEGKQRREAAQVISGQRPAPADVATKPVGEMTDDERLAAFKASILKAPSTSVAAGLTFGK